MNQLEKYQEAIRLLKELNCPDSIMDALYVFGLFVEADDRRLSDWWASQAIEIELTGD